MSFLLAGPTPPPSLPSTQRDILLYFILAVALLVAGALAILWSRKAARRDEERANASWRREEDL